MLTNFFVVGGGMSRMTKFSVLKIEKYIVKLISY